MNRSADEQDPLTLRVATSVFPRASSLVFVSARQSYTVGTQASDSHEPRFFTIRG
ncbi:hypothetical protein BDN71DRAFT_1451775 [Pleurotus eryngii]|uniref:Uncharacterized protein n=1 Tax=Pleurotus eryngii TaxID=5323 RepID=A0A9P5ZT63_PLEER|nr:hypothetical protein BDN71DRAFT_1451775 [Pleurotus eryngii]